QTVATSELGKSQTQKLIEAGETLDLVIALVAIHRAPEFGERKQVHQLSKNRPATVHAPSLSDDRNGPRLHPNSNRFCSFSRPTLNFACGYGESSNQHWDSTDTKVGDALPPGYRAVWARRGRLATAKHYGQIGPATAVGEYSSILVNPGQTPKDD